MLYNGCNVPMPTKEVLPTRLEKKFRIQKGTNSCECRK